MEYGVNRTACFGILVKSRCHTQLKESTDEVVEVHAKWRDASEQMEEGTLGEMRGWKGVEEQRGSFQAF